MENDTIFKKLMAKSRYEIPDRNFEDRVMQKVGFVSVIQNQRLKNLKLSWVFLILSTLLLPVLLILVSKSFFIHYLAQLGMNLSGAANIIMPAAVLVSAIIILLQLDNLFRLTVQLK